MLFTGSGLVVGFPAWEVSIKETLFFETNAPACGDFRCLEQIHRTKPFSSPVFSGVA
jgi:hypothetical protein